MTSYNILSLDGGGIRGYLTISMLERLAEKRPGFIERFDLFAGTSIGSIIALCLANGLSPKEIREMFDEEGGNIFADSLVDNLWDLGFTRGAKYSARNLRRVLVEKFDDAKLGDLEHQVLVPTFDLDNDPDDAEVPRMWKPKFFHNFPGRGTDANEKIVDVALRSSAAPIYFPTYQGYVDGFVVANNPSMCALAQALHENVAPLSRLVVLSLGTGLNPHYFPQQEADWGWRQWLFQMQPRQRRLYVMPLVYMMWEASVDTANYQCKQLIGSRFHRLDPHMPEAVDIDAVNKMEALAAVAQAIDIEPTVKWIDKHLLAEKPVKLAA